MFLIDGSLTFQFFHRKYLKEFEGNENPNSEFYFILNNKFECNNYFKNENPNINFFYTNPILNKNEDEIIYLKEANETTFQKFYYDYLKNKKDELSQKLISININYLEIYAQLNSIIKGSYTSHLYSNNCISKEEYKSKGRRLTDLPDLDSIYDICMKYELYKKKNNYFDIQDLTNHLIRQVKLELINVKLIDYLFIDEIQDLTISQIYLLILISRYIKVYAGDTCQTISKINRFRFSELKNILYNLKKVIPDYPTISNAYLSINFRLNSKIIKLTTFLAYFIRELFPNTLDKFQDDFSIKIIDEKPIYISNINLLIKKFISNKNEKLDNQFLSFSANHCFICRNREYAEKLSNEYNNRIYTLSIEESKGLEYEIVIISDFFSNSPFINEWNLFFQKITLKNDNNIINDIIHEITNLLKVENIDYLNKTLNLPYTINENSIIEEIKKFIYPKCDKSDFDKHRLFEFCSELKKFYVIISRARTFIIFYETGRGYNCEFYNFCIKNNLITLGNEITDDIFYQYLRTYFDKNFKTNFEEYKNKALKFLNSGYYSRAKFLFSEIKENDLMKEAEIYELYENIEEMKNNPLRKEDEYIKLNESLIKKIKENNKFIDKRNLKGECYLNLEEYNDALKCFENDPNRCGIIYFFKVKDYKKAYEKFVIGNNYKYAIECLILLKDEEELFSYINTVKSNLGKYKYCEIYTKYSNIYFEKYLINSKKNILKKDNDINNNGIFNDKKIEEKEKENNKQNEENKKREENENKENKGIEKNKNEETKDINQKKKKRKRQIYQKNKNLIKKENKEEINKIISLIIDFIITKSFENPEKQEIYEEKKEENEMNEKNEIVDENDYEYIIRNKNINIKEINEKLNPINYDKYIFEPLEEKEPKKKFTLIHDFLYQYLYTINIFSQNYNNIYLNYNISEEEIKVLKEELNFSLSVKKFIDCYYLKKKRSFYYEFINICPEIMFFKSEFETKDYLESLYYNNPPYFILNNYSKEEKIKFDFYPNQYNQIIEKIKSKINEMIYNCNLSCDEINYFFSSILIFNNFYELSGQFLNLENQFIISLTLKDIYNVEKIIGKIKIESEYELYYITYKLRLALTRYIKYNDCELINKLENFKRLNSLIDKKNHSQQLPIPDNKDFDILITFFNSNSKMSDIKELQNLMDILSSFSLYLLFVFFKQYSFKNNYIDMTEQIYDLFLNFYNLSNIIISEKLFNEEKIYVLFSFFYIFDIYPIPNITPFILYKNQSVSLININSFLFSQEIACDIHFDIFPLNKNIFYKNDLISIFDNNGNNLILPNINLYHLFLILITKFMKHYFIANQKIIYSLRDPFEDNTKNNKNYDYYYLILYIINTLDYSTEKLYNEQYTFISNQFWENQYKMFAPKIFPKFYPFINLKYQNYLKYFPLDNYIILLFFYDIKEPLFLISYLNDFYNHFSNKLIIDIHKKKNLNLFIFIFKNRWSHLILPLNFSLSKNEFYINPEKNLLNIINLLKENYSSFICTLYILRRLFPLIMNFIKDIYEINSIKIYKFYNENTFINLINIESEIFNKDDKVSIIENYLIALQFFLERIISSNCYYNNFKKDKNEKKDKKISYLSEVINQIYGQAIEYLKENIKFNKNINIDLLEAAYNNNFNLNQNYNWFSKFCELIYFCIYLSFLEIYGKLINYTTTEKSKRKEDNLKNNNEQLIEDNKKDLKFIEKLDRVNERIKEFIDRYENESYYLNFIHEEGSFLLIQKLYEKHFYNNLYNITISYPTNKQKFRKNLFKNKTFYWDSKNEVLNINIENIDESLIFSKKNKDEKCNICLSDIKNSLFNPNFPNKFCSEELYQFLFKSYDNKCDKKNKEKFLDDLLLLIPKK